MMQGTFTPPSHAEPFPSRSPPVLPAWLPNVSHGPLSLVKIMSVFFVNPFLSSAFITSPIDQSISIIKSPNKPAPLLFLYLLDTAIGTCGIECARYKKNGLFLFLPIKLTARSV